MPQPDVASVAETLALVQAQSQSREDIATLAQTAITAEVTAFRGWYDSAQITAWTARLAKLTRTHQKQTAASTASYGLRILRDMLGKRPPSPGTVDVSGLWGGVPMESVYGRLADEYRYLQATRGPNAPAGTLHSPSGAVLDRLTDQDILDRVTARAEVQTDTALSLAMRQQWNDIIADLDGVTGYRRVIHPELGNVCGLCVGASDRAYHVAELMPLHARCRCTVTPIVGSIGGSGDPGSRLNADDLTALYKAAGGTAAGKLAKVRYTVHDHGQLGPVLTAADDAWRGPAQVAADTH